MIGSVEECLLENVRPPQFGIFLRQALTAVITYKRGNAAEEVEILNDEPLLQSIAAEYTAQFEQQQK